MLKELKETIIAKLKQAEENEVYTYVIEADLTATQLGELQDLFLEDADNNAIEIRLNEKGKWEACY